MFPREADGDERGIRIEGGVKRRSDGHPSDEETSGVACIKWGSDPRDWPWQSLWKDSGQIDSRYRTLRESRLVIVGV